MTLLKDLLADPGLPRLEARMLAEHVLGRSRAWLLAHDTDPVEPAAPSPCRWRWVARRPR
ncbi:heme biosynthesis protein [Bordetella pertussis]|nr:heme biosynthesis protein [Bordetella pertussis]